MKSGVTTVNSKPRYVYIGLAAGDHCMRMYIASHVNMVVLHATAHLQPTLCKRPDIILASFQGKCRARIPHVILPFCATAGAYNVKIA